MPKHFSNRTCLSFASVLFHLSPAALTANVAEGAKTAHKAFLRRPLPEKDYAKFAALDGRVRYLAGRVR